MEETGKPTLTMVYIDRIVTATPLERVRMALDKASTITKNEGGLLMLFTRSGSEELIKSVSNMSDRHLRLLNQQGVILFHGMRPRTLLYALEMDRCPGYTKLRMTPLV
ncbi:MAG: hypothetical protein ACE5OO_08765, partial [Candidatus Bathyarchaeia archaeon]